jgi:hypothetical protein
MTGLTGYQTVNDKEVGSPPWNRGWWSDWPLVAVRPPGTISSS